MNHIITASHMKKFNKIFHQLLRLLRLERVLLCMKTTLSAKNWSTLPISISLNRSLKVFVADALIVVQVIRTHSHQGAILPTWRRFMSTVERSVTNSDGINSTGLRIYSLSDFNDLQHHCLDRIMDRLLLRRKQAPMLHLLNKGFDRVLQMNLLMTACQSKRRWTEGDNQRAAYLKNGFYECICYFVEVLNLLKERLGSWSW